MIEISENDYREIAGKLLEAIGDAEFFNGAIAVRVGEFDAQLRVTLIVKRDMALDPADFSLRTTRITDIVPVWWECRLYSLGGELSNDFSWRELKNYMQ